MVNINKTKRGIYYLQDYIPEKKRDYYGSDDVEISQRLIDYKYRIAIAATVE